MKPGPRLSSPRRSGPIIELLKQREFRLLWIAVTISQIGDWMQITAQGWLALELGGSAVAVTTVTAAGILPQLLLNLLGGIAADHIPKRTLMRIIALAQLSISGILTFLVVTNIINVTGLILFTFLLGCVAAMWQPVYLTFIPEVVPSNRLENAMGLSLSALYTARTVGPALAGVLIATLGTEVAYLLNSLTFVAPIITLLFIRTAGVPLKRRASPLQTLGGSVRTVLRDDVLRPLWAATAALSLLALPCLALIPVFAQDVFETGAVGLGVLMTGSGLGQLLGAILLSVGLLNGIRSSGLFQMIGYAIMGLLLICFALSQQAAIAFLMLLGFNLFHGLLSPRVNAMVQRRIAAERGTAQSLFLLVFGLVPLGQIALGWLTERVGPVIATSWFALGFTTIALLLLSSASTLRSYTVIQDERNAR